MYVMTHLFGMTHDDAHDSTYAYAFMTLHRYPGYPETNFMQNQLTKITNT